MPKVSQGLLSSPRYASLYRQQRHQYDLLYFIYDQWVSDSRARLFYSSHFVPRAPDLQLQGTAFRVACWRMRGPSDVILKHPTLGDIPVGLGARVANHTARD